MDQITDHISFYFKLLDFCKKKTLTFIHHIRVMYKLLLLLLCM